MTHRLETRPGWRSIVALIRLAGADALARCQTVIEARARNQLSQRGYEVPKLELADAGGQLQALFEAADEHYLNALDANDGVASEVVMNEFAIARGLASLVSTRRGNGADQVLDAAYELAAIGSEEEEGLNQAIAAVLAAQ